MDTKDNRDFASYLDQIRPASAAEDSEDAEDAAPYSGALPFDYLAVADELHSGRIQLQGDRRKTMRDDADEPYRAELEAYLDSADTLLVPEPRTEAEALPSVEPEDIAAELGLDHAPSAELGSIRRHFAFANHPDRVAPHLRDRAMTRMQVANMLIDAAQNKAGLSTRR